MKYTLFCVIALFLIACQQPTETTEQPTTEPTAQKVENPNPTRFATQIEKYKSDSADYENLILFTGSSSIRFWKTLATDFPNHTVINRGFGGSQMSDLLHYQKELIIDNAPKQVFIYEGDNDLAVGKRTVQIMDDTKTLVANLRSALPDVKMVFIGAKPSIARKELNEYYLDFNATLKTYCEQEADLDYVDVWNPMMLEDGSLNEAIFIEDGLHMNEEGYKIWRAAVLPYLEGSY